MPCSVWSALQPWMPARARGVSADPLRNSLKIERTEGREKIGIPSGASRETSGESATRGAAASLGGQIKP
eukprot:6634602-Prymnesium_polylepis.1